MMTINWSPLTLGELQHYLKKTYRTNWLQTWAYAQATFRQDHLRCKWGIIEKFEQKIGLVCIQEIILGPIQVINIHRGPLWFHKPTDSDLVDFAYLIKILYPKKLLQRFRWNPQHQFTEESSISKIQGLGFKLRSEYFLTSWIDLSKSIFELRNSLNQKWRNCLNKSYKYDLKVQSQTKLIDNDLFFKHYAQHLLLKKYKGPSESFLKIEFSELEKTNNIFYFWCFQNSKPVSCMVFTLQGTTASYRIGWNTPNGRHSKSHYFLIWHAIEKFKNMEIHFLDLGGLLPEEASGVTHFKSGLNGESEKYLFFSL